MAPTYETSPRTRRRGSNLISTIERVSPNDAVTLATDHGPAPMNIGAVLIVDAAADLDLTTVRSILELRLPRVRRLRQRLMATPFGCGRPIWVDHSGFDLDRHLSEVSLDVGPTSVGDSDARLLRIAADLVCTRLDQHEPLWRAQWVRGLSDDRAALVLVINHALTDGVGGLAVLSALGDEAAGPAADDFPRPRPPRSALAADAWRDRGVALAQVPGRLRAGRAGLRELGIRAQRPTLAARTSLNRPTGPRRRLTTVDVPIGPLLAQAHRRGCTINDLLLVAVSGAMAGVLNQRGEHPGQLVVSVPISARRTTTVAQLGNQTGVRPLAIPTLADQDARLQSISTLTSEQSGVPRGSSAGPMGLVFRALGVLGIFQHFIDHQRLVHTFVTNVRGPAVPVHFAGHTVSRVIPVAITPGNVGVCFDVLSYAGRLVTTVVGDPDIVPEQDLLTRLLEDELRQLLG